MRHAVSRALDRSGLPFQAVEDNMNEADFVLPGAVPSLVEIKFGAFGNVNMPMKKAAEAVKAFNKCRYIVFVIGTREPEWDELAPYVSALEYFDPASHSHECIDSEAEEWAFYQINRIESTRLLTAAAKFPEFPRPDWVGVTPEDRKDRESDHGTPLEILFGQDIAAALFTISKTSGAIFCGEPGEAVEHELDCLKHEYESEHFTSCALRIGRTVELAIYGFSKRLGISPLATIYPKIEQIRDRLKQADSALLNLASVDRDSQSSEYDKHRRQVVKAAQLANRALMDLVSGVDDLIKDPSKPTRPDNLQSILRRAKHHLSLGDHPPRVHQMLDQFIKENDLKQILDVRNNAAHGDPGLCSREVSKEEVNDVLLKAAALVQDLANIVTETKSIP